MKHFSLLIKPASADCNLRCNYCFYLDHASLYPQDKVHRMSEETLETMIRSFMSVPLPNYSFGWQGGEPTLMGLPFFKKAVALQKQYGRPGSVVSNGLQTNATLITDEMAEFLGEYKFLLGVSLDGPREIHDHYRRDAANEGSFDRILKTIDRLNTYSVDFNTLILVNDQNVTKAREVYEFHRDIGSYYQQYIPCVEFDNSGSLLPFSINGQQWGDFLCELFDCWIARDTRKVSIRLFDSILSFMVENRYNVCHMGRNCRQYFVVEYNGDIYPCDFFVYPELKLGNIRTVSWQEAYESSTFKQFGASKTKWNGLCHTCEFLPFCSGDCMKHRNLREKGPDQLSVLCQGWKQFYSHSLKKFEKLAREIIAERSAQQGPYPPPVSDPQLQKNYAHTGRNDPCPCGSGKKFKRCCMK